MAVDVSAIVAAIAAIALVRATRTHEAVDEAARASDGDVTIGWGFAAAALSVLPFVWASFPEIPPLPASLAALQSPGKLTIVSFTDFECPYCRLLHPVVEEAKKRPDVVLQRFMVPLDGHLGALPAAQGYLCVPAEKQDEMAHALYAAEPKGMMPNAVVDLGVSLGMERSALIACMTSPATAATIAEHKRLFFDELAGQGLPTTYVGDRMIKGAQVDKLRALIAHGPKPALVLPVWALFVSAIGVLVAAVSYGIRLTERPRPSDPTPAEG
jgi:thiol-disulfide isomerase/thioredoxin